MSLHKITAGSGYDYLTRQVARMDSTEGARPSLASYYTEKGEVPGRWVGSGLAGLAAHGVGVRPLEVGDEVTAAHMQALYGAGFHPQAAERQQRLLAAREDYPAVWAAASRLGTPFRVYNDDVTEFRVEVARRFAAFNRQRGRRDDAPIPLDDRARMRSEVARETFVRENGRDLLDERERAGNLARLSRQRTTAVAGFDLTFSPVKSVSTLWALAPPNIAATIERAHDQAVAAALTFIEHEALYTRLGDGGVRQVDTRGLIAAAFTHRDSRAGDPDLHTHVAVANKVQDAKDGRWLAIDGRVLYKAIVAASETYNTALEKHLTTMLGVEFAERPNPDLRKRPVREIVGVEPSLNERWSARRQAIEARRSELATTFQATHGRPPSPTESIALAQQANLETRDAKHAPRSLAEQRATWHREALDTLGSQQAIDRMIHTALHPTTDTAAPTITAAWLDDTARRVVATVERNRSTWQYWHLHAEATRRVRAAHLHPTQITQTVARIVDRARDQHSIALSRANRISEPDALRRRDGTSVYQVAGSTLYTSRRTLDAEARILAHAGHTDGHTIDTEHVAVALLETAANGVELNTGQAHLVTQMATSGARVQVAIAPAGSGKTTAMDALTRAWTSTGGTVVGLAPSAAAAAQLRDQTSATTDTLAKLVDSLDRGRLPEWASAIDRQTLVIIDEAGMADTLTLDAALEWLIGRGASVRLIGDDQQLAAIGAGGVLRDIEATHGVLRLNELVRFADPAEGAASLAIRDGRPEGLGFYLDHHRIHVGDLATLTENVFTAWSADRTAGRDSIMLAPTRDLVTNLNQRARTHRLNGDIPDADVLLADGSRASIGDTIVTRANDRRLRLSATDWVKNGDRWTITNINPVAGTIRARHTGHGLHITLPADYVASNVDLGYACTIHTAQGVSVDTTHGLTTANESRQQLYTMLTRGRHTNHVYLEVVTDGNEHSLLRPETLNPNTPTDLLETILARDTAPVSASTQLRGIDDLAPRLGDAAAAYYDALGVAAESLRSELDLYTLERRTNQMVPGVTLADAWPALRTKLLYLAAHGRDPYAALDRALGDGPLGDAHDPAAVLAWRLDTTTIGRRGPLPWLPGIPDALREHPTWGAYLEQRHQLVVELADGLHQQVLADPRSPGWLVAGMGDPTPRTLADIAVWRAATRTEPADARPLGPAQPSRALARHQQQLHRRLNTDRNPAVVEWQPLIVALDALTERDDFLPVLAQRLAQLSAAGLDAARLVRDAAEEGRLPDDHAAAALWWRIDRHLTPETTVALTGAHRLPEDWLDTLSNTIGEDAAARLKAAAGGRPS
jgi:conjugative relaxase-like TrwC/TraI family protein